MKENTQIQEGYISFEQNLTQRFLRAIGRESDPVEWIVDDGDRLLLVGGFMCVSLYTVMLVVSSGMAQEDYYEWYDYSSRAAVLKEEFGCAIPYISPEDWMRGATRLSLDALAHLEAIGKEIAGFEDAKREAEMSLAEARRKMQDAVSVYRSAPNLFPSRINVMSENEEEE